MRYEDFSGEQKQFIEYALEGYNVLVDACIGAGKTTSIQYIFDQLSKMGNKEILYLTYNKLLKVDAQQKIKVNSAYSYVSNYHGYALRSLKATNPYGADVAPGDLLTEYKKVQPRPLHYDVLILDEYQDIDSDIAWLLNNVKRWNPSMQIIAVGDMDQKLYDRTTLRPNVFIDDFLGKDYKRVQFTYCFRLSEKWAHALGAVWGKTIRGRNLDCKIAIMTSDEAFHAVRDLNPNQLLCLGSEYGGIKNFQNRLEEECPTVYNRYTVWSKIMNGGVTRPDQKCAIFTTYDGSKGMERDVCILFDWTKTYFQQRLTQPHAKYEIIRNIFLVAASRGKKTIIFIDDIKKVRATYHRANIEDLFRVNKSVSLLSLQDIASPSYMSIKTQKRFDVSTMFDYKNIEDVEDCYKLLKITSVQPAGAVIDAPSSIGFIDLSPCLGNFQEASYFKKYNIDAEIANLFTKNRQKGAYLPKYNTDGWSLFKKVLYLTCLETGQVRYITQVPENILEESVVHNIHARLSECLDRDDIVHQAYSQKFGLSDYNEIMLNGVCDVYRNNIVYELKFVTSLSHVHYLQCACYMVLMDLKTGVLWNVRTNEMALIEIPNRTAFIQAVIKTITKGKNYNLYFNYNYERFAVDLFKERHKAECDILRKEAENGILQLTEESVDKFMDSCGLVLPVSTSQFLRYLFDTKNVVQNIKTDYVLL